jgi:hypothetical protein
MTPVETARAYYRDVWSQHRVGRIARLCADPVLGHDPSGVRERSHAEQRARILGHVERKLRFWHRLGAWR